MSDNSWYSQGFDKAKEVQQQQAAARAKGFTRRLWVPFKAPDNSAEIIVLGGVVDQESGDPTSEPFLYWETSWRTPDSKFPFYATSTARSGGKCPFAEAGLRPYFAGAFTILNLSKYTDRNGGEHQNERQLAVCKNQTLDLLATLRESLDGKSLVNQRFKLIRTKNTDPVVGSTWVPMGRVDPTEFLNAEGQYEGEMFDYMELLKPMSYDEGKGYLAEHPPRVENRDQNTGGGGNTVNVGQEVSY